MYYPFVGLITIAKPQLVLQGRDDICGLLSGESQPNDVGEFSSSSVVDWSRLSGASSVTSQAGLGHSSLASSSSAASIVSSYATTVVSSPSLASVQQSSFDDSESASFQECFQAASDLFMNHPQRSSATEGITAINSPASSSDDGSGILQDMDIDEARELLSSAAVAAAAAIELPSFEDPYSSNYQPEAQFQPQNKSSDGRASVHLLRSSSEASHHHHHHQQQQLKKESPNNTPLPMMGMLNSRRLTQSLPATPAATSFVHHPSHQSRQQPHLTQHHSDGCHVGTAQQRPRGDYVVGPLPLYTAGIAPASSYTEGASTSFAIPSTVSECLTCNVI